MKVDLIVSNAKIYTVNKSFDIAQSFAITDGKFVAVGSNDDIAQKYFSDDIIDAGGNFIYPGFNDAHCHFYGYGMNLMQYADLSGAKSQDEIIRILKEHHSKNGGNWLLGRGWDQNLWPVKEFPDNEMLNKEFPQIPVYLIRIDGHAAWCNNMALHLAGINPKSSIEGGEFLQKNGILTGVLIDNAKDLVSKIIPIPDIKLKEYALLAAQKNCFEVGLTSVTDCGLSKETIFIIDSLQKRANLKMRINAMIDPENGTLEYFLKNGIYKTNNLQVNTIKLYADGALGSRGAFLINDYSDDIGNKGLMMNSSDYYETICQKAYDAGFQVATHCIGDGANRFMLNTYGKVLKTKNDRRWRIEHAQIVHNEDIDLFRKYSIIPSVQATHATSDMLWASGRLGPERLKTAYMYKDLLNQNGWLPNGTDFPIEGINPLQTFYASVYRKNIDGIPVEGFQIENALSKEQALRSITIWPAMASFEENEKGSIKTGKTADFVILNNDFMNCPEEEILKTKVISTWVSGARVFELKQ